MSGETGVKGGNMKKEIGLAVIGVLLFSGVSYAGLFGKSDKEVEEEIRKREAVLTDSFNETLARKDNENARISAELEETKKKLEETNKQLEEMQQKQAVVPAQEKVEETRSLEEILTTEITKYAQVLPSDEGLKIIFGTDFFFYFDVLEPSIYRSLDVIIKVLKSYPEHRVLISGYTDSAGDKNKNLSTSLIKAKAVANYLIAKGTPEEKITVKGLGPASPVDTNKTKEGRKQNRRIEVIIVKK